MGNRGRKALLAKCLGGAGLGMRSEMWEKAIVSLEGASQRLTQLKSMSLRFGAIGLQGLLPRPWEGPSDMLTWSYMFLKTLQRQDVLTTVTYDLSLSLSLLPLRHLLIRRWC